MKRRFYTSIAFAALASSPVFAAPQSPVNWTGFYAGAGTGLSYSETRSDYAHDTSTCSNNNYGSDGGGACGGNQNYKNIITRRRGNAIGGIFGGYNWQWRSLVMGIEPSLHYRKQKERHFEFVSPAFGDSLEMRTEQNYLATLRGTIGVPVKDFLLYGTFGASAGNVKTIVTQSMPGTDPREFQNSETQLGYVVGGGVKYHLNRNWVVGGEFLFVDLGNSHASAPNLVMPGGLTYPLTNVTTHNTSSTAQLNLTYQF